MSDSAPDLPPCQSERKRLEDEARDGVAMESPEPQTERPGLSLWTTLEKLSEKRIVSLRIQALGDSCPKQGASADVQLAKLLPEFWSFKQGSIRHVALKKYRLDDGTEDEKKLTPFAKELKLLSELKHDNIVELTGFVENTDQGIAWVVLPWAANGNLREFVQSESWEIPELTSLIRDVMCGLAYLHEREEPICHGDLKSLNVLVNKDYRAIITDFGSARIIKSKKGSLMAPERVISGIKGPKIEYSPVTGSITMTSGDYTIRWAAPEVLNGDPPSVGSDIWALGWICWEAVTGELPFGNLSDSQVVVRVTRGELPQVGDNTNLAQVQVLCHLIEKCWLSHSERPPIGGCRTLMADVETVVPSRDATLGGARIRSAKLLKALGRWHLTEGRLGEGVRYLLKSAWVARLKTRGGFHPIQQSHVEACLRPTGGLQSGNELDAAESWNLAIRHCIDFEYPEAQSQIIVARRLYHHIGLQAQTLECDHLLEELKEMIAEQEAEWILHANHPPVAPVPKIVNACFGRRGTVEDMIYFIAGALKQEARPLTAQEIVSTIERYQPWRIKWPDGADTGRKRVQVTNNICRILAMSPAFAPDRHSRWSFTGRPLVMHPSRMTKEEAQAYLNRLRRLFGCSNSIIPGHTARPIPFIT